MAAKRCGPSAAGPGEAAPAGPAVRRLSLTHPCGGFSRGEASPFGGASAGRVLPALPRGALCGGGASSSLGPRLCPRWEGEPGRPGGSPAGLRLFAALNKMARGPNLRSARRRLGLASARLRSAA